jgi:GT2 family glycosyltransferase
MIAGPPALAPGRMVVPGKVAIIVLNWNAEPFLRRALDSIVRHTRQPYQLVVVDNGSIDASKAFIREFAHAHPAVDMHCVDHADNLYFSRGYNTGFQAAAEDAEYLMVFCNDVEVKEDGWLEPLIAACGPPDVVAAGHAAPGTPVSAEQRDILQRTAPRYAQARLAERMRIFVESPIASYTHLFGYCFLLRRHLLTHTGLYLEEADFQQYHSDWEWCMRFEQLGYRIASAPMAVHHWHSVSELLAFYPHRYRELLTAIEEPQTLATYLATGRPLFQEESGYRMLAGRTPEREAE